jgi:hypothetical protein
MLLSGRIIRARASVKPQAGDENKNPNDPEGKGSPGERDGAVQCPPEGGDASDGDGRHRQCPDCQISHSLALVREDGVA